MRLSALERKILNCIQVDIHFDVRPFSALAKKVGVNEDVLIKKMKRLKENGIIRNFSAGINHKKLGFKSSLIALRVADNNLESVVKKIVPYPEVTHCFLRKGEFNLWTVFIYKGGALKKFLPRLTKLVGKKNILNLPTVRKFKLKVALHI